MKVNLAFLKKSFALWGLTLLTQFLAFEVFAQTNFEVLDVNREKTFTLGRGAEKTYRLNLKKGDIIELFWEETGGGYPAVSLQNEAGMNVFDEDYFDSSVPLVVPADGGYNLKFKNESPEESAKPLEIKVRYAGKFRLSKNAKLQRSRKINGYDVKVYNVFDEDTSYGTYLVIEKSGKLLEVAKSGSLVGGGYNFGDDARLWEANNRPGKRSALLFRTTPDKTGDGAPDIAVQSYSGGAHCCTTMYFYELGAGDLKKIKPVKGGDSDVYALRKNPAGGLYLQTGDSTFAYWLTSFAGSPIPTVILSFRNGEFRADADAMKKRAPTEAAIKAKAAAAKKEMTLAPYTGTDSFNELNPFWGEMLDWIYSGNERAAWQYFDLVWDARKPGKEKFKADFLEQLNKSEFYRQIAAGGK